MGFGSITTAAVSCFNALFGAACFLGYYPIAEAVAECGFVFRSIAGAAGAGIGGVALLSAGRCSYYCGVAVAECCNLAGFCSIAATAIACFNSVFGAGCCLGNYPCAKVMAQLVCTVRGIDIAAVSAGICSAAVCCAGRCDYGFYVIMSDCFNNTGFRSIAA